MGVRIKSAPVPVTDLAPFTPDTALPIPEPWGIKVRSLLKPWHPFLFFDWKVLDDDLVFQLGIRDFYCRDLWIHDRFPRLGALGVWPLADFGDPEQTAQAYDRFSLYVFRCLARLVTDMIGTAPAGLLERERLVVAGRADWQAVVHWLGCITEPLSPWLDREVLQVDGRLRFFVHQPLCQLGAETVPGWLFEDVGREIRPWHPVQPTDLANLDIAAISFECAEIADQQGEAQSERLLRKLLLERIVNGLYFWRFAL